MSQNAASSEAEAEDVFGPLMTQDELASSCPEPKDPAGTAVTCLPKARGACPCRPNTPEHAQARASRATGVRR